MGRGPLGRALPVAVVAVLFAAGCSGGGDDDAVEATTTSTAVVTTTTARPTTTTAPYAPVAALTQVVSAWAPGGLDPLFTAALPTLPGVVASTVVQGDRLMLADGAPPGMGIPLDALAIDPATYPAFVAPEVQEPLARLAAGQAILGATSSLLRGGIGPGGTLTMLDGTRFTVTAVLPDEAVAGAELVVARGTTTAVHTDRYALVAHAGDVQAVAGELRSAFPADRPLRVRQPGEVPFLRHGDGVLTDAQVKATFGEIAFTEGPTRDFAAWDTAWADEHIGTLAVPIIGSAECNKAMLPDLRAALADVDELQTQLVEDELAEAASTSTTVPPDPDPNVPITEPPPLEPIPPPLLEPDANLGCWNPRLIEPGAGVSRHAYGIAIDLRAPAATGEHDPRLVEIFEAHGFTWGGDFLASDPIHFEWVGP